MGSTLDALHRLQGIELQLATLRGARGTKSRQVQIYKRKAAALEKSLRENREQCRQSQIQVDALTLDATAREETITKHRQALGQAKTNKEYAAILTAMNTEKAENAKFESDILQLMESLQTVQQQGAELESERNTALDQVATREAALRNFDAESEERRLRLEEERSACAEAIPPAAIASFDRAAGHHDGEGMAVVTKLSPKRDEYVCSGCNMGVTLEAINTLQTRDEIQTCNACGRLLYLEAQAAR